MRNGRGEENQENTMEAKRKPSEGEMLDFLEHGCNLEEGGREVFLEFSHQDLIKSCRHCWRGGLETLLGDFEF